MCGHGVCWLAGILVLAAAACGGAEQARVSSTVLKGVAIMPRSVPTSAANGAEAAETVFRTGAVPDSVAAWYRRWFVAHGWEISGDARMPDGSLTLHAEKPGRLLWIMIQPGSDHVGSSYSVVGAEPGAGARRPAAR